jgi:hypothetical protein
VAASAGVRHRRSDRHDAHADVAHRGPGRPRLPGLPAWRNATDLARHARRKAACEE